MGPSQHLRPLGPIHWILDKLPGAKPWSVVGSLSPEDRCLAAAQEVLGRDSDSTCTLLKLAPHSRARNLDEVRSRLAENEKQARDELSDRVTIHRECPLHSSDHEVIEAVQELADQCEGRVIVDISTMPKRWFFPLVRELVEAAHIKTLIAANTKPARYAKHGTQLATDADSWEPLPGYLHSDVDADETTAIIGVGYHTLNLHEFIGESTTRKIDLKLFLPFPSLHPGFRQNWEFVRDITAAWKGPLRPEIVRVPTDDVSLVFDRLKQQSQEGRTRSLVLAPFGPKPMSLAMCLLGIAREREYDDNVETEIGYTQPKAYAADYSVGVGMRDSTPIVNAYCIRLNGRDLYSVT